MLLCWPSRGLGAADATHEIGNIENQGDTAITEDRGAGYAFNAAEVSKDTDPSLVGRRKENAPRHTATLWGRWQATERLGFGLGAAVTSLFVLHTPSLTPPSFWLYLGAAALALVSMLTLKDDSTRQAGAEMLRLPSYPAGAFGYGLAILLAWASVGLVIAILPSALGQHGLSGWAGFATFGICSCGVLFQPWARKLAPQTATQLGLVILPLAYGLIVWGALQGHLVAVLAGAVAASSACYGFIYLGGLSGVLSLAVEHPSRASAGYFLMAYLGFSIPVITTGVLVDVFGHTLALGIFGLALLGGTVVTLGIIQRGVDRAAMPAWTARQVSKR